MNLVSNTRMASEFDTPQYDNDTPSRQHGELPDRSPLSSLKSTDEIVSGIRVSTVDRHEIPDIVVRRLPLYVRTLRQLQEMNIDSVSSQLLAQSIGVTAAQIRRDLSYFGKFGKQGTGYDTAFLLETFAHILKLDRQWPVALVGFGNLGRAISQYRGLLPSSFTIAAIFDRKHDHVGSSVDDIVIQSNDAIKASVALLGIQLGIIAVPAPAAQEVANSLTAGGVRAILNYAPILLHVPEGVTVREVDPISAMQSMTYYLDD